MKTLTSTICAAALAVASFATAAVPAHAQGVQTLRIQPGQGEIIEVQQRYRGDYRRGFERRGDWGYYNGHRGYRDRRPGYRQHRGFWFPPEAFIGAIIGGVLGGAIANQPARQVIPSGLSDRHIAWCQDRYRSYRLSDNSFQPYNGPRRSCNSPFG